MPVTDEQEATLHTALAGRFGEYERMLDELDPVAARTGFSALVAAAFSIAADEHFPESVTETDVIEYVGQVRSRSDNVARMDPRVAERVLLTALTGAKSDDIDATTSFQAQLVLLAAMVADQRMEPGELDRFMLEARELANEWTD